MKWRFDIELSYEHPIMGLRHVSRVTVVGQNAGEAIDRARRIIGDFSALVENIDRVLIPPKEEQAQD